MTRQPLTAAGITLAVPVSTVTREVEKILDNRALAGALPDSEPAPWMGFVAEDIDDKPLRSQLKIEEGGVLICQIYAGQPAAKAGIQKHDVLVKFQGEPVEGLDHLQTLFTKAAIGQEVKLVLLRNGKEIEKVVVIGKH
jgi:serine protease Do